jgi:hypothetical protein
MLRPLRCRFGRRVFGDKLASQEDKGWLDKALAELCKNDFPPELCKQVGSLGHQDQSLKSTCRNADPPPRPIPPQKVEEPLYFVDFLREPVVDGETGEVIEVRARACGCASAAIETEVTKTCMLDRRPAWVALCFWGRPVGCAPKQ